MEHGAYKEVRLWSFINAKYSSKSTQVTLFIMWGITKKYRDNDADLDLKVQLRSVDRFLCSLNSNEPKLNSVKA